MKRKRFTEEQIIGILKEFEAGAKNQELCRKHGTSAQTIPGAKITLTPRLVLHAC